MLAYIHVRKSEFFQCFLFVLFHEVTPQEENRRLGLCPLGATVTPLKVKGSINFNRKRALTYIYGVISSLGYE